MFPSDDKWTSVGNWRTTTEPEVMVLETGRTVGGSLGYVFPVGLTLSSESSRFVMQIAVVCESLSLVIAPSLYCGGWLMQFSTCRPAGGSCRN